MKRVVLVKNMSNKFAVINDSASTSRPVQAYLQKKQSEYQKKLEKVYLELQRLIDRKMKNE